MRNRAGWLVGVLLLAGCGGASEAGGDTTGLVCDDFAAFAQDGRPSDQRSEVVSGIGDLIGNADPGVADAFDGLTATVNNPTEAADDAFAQACFDAGWEG